MKGGGSSGIADGGVQKLVNCIQLFLSSPGKILYIPVLFLLLLSLSALADIIESIQFQLNSKRLYNFRGEMRKRRDYFLRFFRE